MTELKKVDVMSHDLPLSCPSNQEILWSAHPKVYLAIEKTGEAACPYCGKVFHLVDFEQFKNRAKGH